MIASDVIGKLQLPWFNWFFSPSACEGKTEKYHTIYSNYALWFVLNLLKIRSLVLLWLQLYRTRNIVLQICMHIYSILMCCLHIHLHQVLVSTIIFFSLPFFASFQGACPIILRKFKYSFKENSFNACSRSIETLPILHAKPLFNLLLVNNIQSHESTTKIKSVFFL